ncbi:DUF4296 domain-containing protein [Polaribacter sp. Z014]|uniref:DUF4296 domain-containing protein n=1 Tax=Polaribacter sp. Z014 TaxID=2927126 RepID=UPI0020228990|nr:DUF4296 domain-containing protein [Polaribacter sp. Z014]MCL7762222.1 DUF4296 domain-containing protein [Polaribacter sp. Z014]
MKKLSYLLILTFLVSCTSNTIFKKPEDLIPRDTMTLLLGDMMIASSAKYVKNINEQKKINYMPFIYEKYKIDSLRFQKSNFYYISKIDLYEEIFTDVKKNLVKQKDFYSNLSKQKDSIRRDSIKSSLKLKEIDTIEVDKPDLEPSKKMLKKKN